MSILVNRGHLARVLAAGHPVARGVNRAVGKTTGAVLRAIGLSCLQPGEWVLVDDPDADTDAKRKFTAHSVTTTMARLGLVDIEVVTRPGATVGDAPITPGVYIRNTFAERLA